MITEEQGQILTRLARQTIEERAGLPASDPVSPADRAQKALQEQRGVFVTLNKRGSLRGCIGSLDADESIIDGVRRHAANAAFHDHRFSQVTAEEVDQLHIDVSVLTEPRQLNYTSAEDLLQKLRPSIDGVILLAASGAGATFLPQVWRQLPTPEQFLGHLCRKAGLPDDTWRSEHLIIQVYQVQSFEEPR